MGGAIEGISLPHSECVTISDFFTTELQDGTRYRPTVSYCYLPSDSAMASLHEVRMNNWQIPEKHRILANDIIDGADELGVLLLGSPHGGWWFGSRLTIEETRTIIKDTNPTAMQVAAGVLGAAKWILDNPSEGYCESEDLPFEQILQYALPYLGSLISTKTEWHPFKDERVLFDDVLLDREDPWQFNNFIVHPGFRGAR
jgi:homospermidine synthase